jgi:hypothetical protein
MLQFSRVGHPTAAPTLEGCAEGAGRALACIFSSSDEYEAALIAERRAEGRYGLRRRRAHLMLLGAVMLAVAVIVSVLV